MYQDPIKPTLVKGNVLRVTPEKCVRITTWPRPYPARRATTVWRVSLNRAHPEHLITGPNNWKKLRAVIVLRACIVLGLEMKLLKDFAVKIISVKVVHPPKCRTRLTLDSRWTVHVRQDDIVRKEHRARSTVQEDGFVTPRVQEKAVIVLNAHLGITVKRPDLWNQQDFAWKDGTAPVVNPRKYQHQTILHVSPDITVRTEQLGQWNAK